MRQDKLFVGVLVLFGVLLLSGCGLTKEQTLLCTASQSGVDVGFNVKFKGYKIEQMDITYDMDLSKYNDIQIEAISKQDFCEVVKKSMSQYKDAFTECKQDVSNKNLHVATGLEVDKVAKSELDKFSSIDNAKEGLEKVGYSCTIK